MFFEKLSDFAHLSRSLRIWGGILVVIIIGGILFTQSEVTSSSKISIVEEVSPVTPTPTSIPTATPAFFEPLIEPLPEPHFEPLSDATTTLTQEAVPLQSASTVAPLPSPPATPTPFPTPQFFLHTVRQGETLISIAATYELSTETLLATNEIRDPTVVKAGQTLLIPPSEGVRIPFILHEIMPGDSLLSLAAQYGSSIKDILTANPALEVDALLPGESLVVPIIFNQPKVTPRETNAEGPVYYTVKNGDIPLTIAAQFEIPVEILLAANDIADPTRLQVGQELMIPPPDDVSFGFPVILHELIEGNSLLSIASQYGSSVKDILAINPELDPAVMNVGELVAVPIIFRQPRPTPVPNSPQPTPEPFEVSQPLIDLQGQMLDLINAERAANGLPPYQIDETIAEVAVNHAQDMVTRSYLAHITPEGKTVQDRVEASGVTDALRVGENIQVNTRPPDRTVQAALNWFMNSRPHRRGILHERYNQVGIGIVSGPPGWYTVVIVFVER